MQTNTPPVFLSADEWYLKHPSRIEYKPTEKMLDDICSGHTVYTGIQYTVDNEIRTTTILVHLDDIFHSIDQDGNRCDHYTGSISHMEAIPDSQIHGLCEQQEIVLEWKHILEFDHAYI